LFYFFFFPKKKKKKKKKKRTEENKTHMPEPEPTFDGNCSLSTSFYIAGLHFANIIASLLAQPTRPFPHLALGCSL
jgi:hypothetical protein